MLELETERLKFRLWKLEDFEAFRNYFSNPDLARFVGGTKTPEESWRLMASYVGHTVMLGYGYLAVETKEKSQLIGTVGLWKSEPWPETELGYWLLPEMQRHGYAVEAATSVLNYAFQKLRLESVVSYIDKDNEPSIRLSKKLGGVYDGNIDLLEFGTHQVYRYHQLSCLSSEK